MFSREIKVDTIILQKKAEKTSPKPRTVWFQGGGDDVTISTYLIPARRKGRKHVAAMVNGVNQTRVEQIISTNNIPDQFVAPEEVSIH